MLELALLGPPEVRLDGVPWRPPTRKSVALLAILAADGSMPRGRLCALLWPELDESPARRNLRRELARLREGGLEAAIRVDGDRLALEADVRVDVAAFRRIVGAAAAAGLGAWRGPFCDGLQVADAPELDAWLRDRRSELLALRQDALARSAAAHEEAGRPRQALEQVRRLLADDPVQEQQHRAAMRLHAALGEHQLAATGGAFGYNDTSGTLLSFRGWALHDLKATAFGHIPLPTLSFFMTGPQAPKTRSLLEIDAVSYTHLTLPTICSV